MAKILIIDDSPFVVKLLTHALQKEGHDTISASNGIIGLKEARGKEWDLILLDLLLPDMDGDEVCRVLKSDNKYRHIPIIMLTGKDELDDKVKGLDSGADDYVTKSSDMRELLARVRKTLRLKELQDLTYKQAITDSLTMLYNRRFFRERLIDESSRARRYTCPLSCIMIDIDHFKEINDNYSHQMGDLILKQLADLFIKNVRLSDMVCRYGGEEFVILLPETDLSGAEMCAEKIRNAVANTLFGTESSPLRITISCGCCSFPESPISEPEEIVTCADTALYEAKRAGRNCVKVYR